MGATYTRQSSYSDGDVIQATDTNNEFDQLLAAFQAASGHTHDGTANEGGSVTKMLGSSLTLGDGTAGNDVVVTYDGETNDGVMSWMEDEDYFEFSDDLLIASTEKLQFRDTGLYIYSSTDGQLDIVADTEVQIAATTIDINGAVDVSGNLDVGGNLTVTGTTTLNGGTLTLGDAATDNVVFGADVNSSIIPNTDDSYDLGSTGQRWKDAYVDGIAYIDAINLTGTAITSTAAELNIVDGDTSASAVTVVDADRVVLNDGGTMKQVAVTDLAAYFDDEITAMPNLITTAATTVGVLNSGSITSGFGTIDTGASAITTTGLISGGSLDIDSVLINGANIGHTDDIDLITLSNGVVTVAGELDAVSLDVSGDVDIDGTLEADAITINGITLSETIADTVGAMVGSNTETGIAVTYDDADNTIDFVIGAGAIVNSMLADDAVGADELASNAVVTASIVDANVTTAKIAADAVTGAKIADDTIDSEHYAAGSIDLEHMSANSVDSDQYVDGSIDTIHISADAITGAKIADDAIDSEHYTDGSIDTAHIADSQITVAKMAINSVDSDQYVDGSIDTAHIADSQITVAKMAVNSIDSDQYVDGSIDTAHISADAITEAKIADNAVQSEHINDNVISGQTSLASGIADADELLISDAGLIKRTAMSVIKTYIGAADDATALAIALG
jgi:cytoskeletal protein CcmA (bactofilin family)